MVFRILLAIISAVTPFVGLLGGLYHLGVFKKTVVKRTTYAVVLMVLSIPVTLISVVSLVSPSTSQEVTIDDKTEAVATPTAHPNRR